MQMRTTSPCVMLSCRGCAGPSQMWTFSPLDFSCVWGRCTVASRLELQTLLESILALPNVYFQPPSNIQMQYPCIVYKRDDSQTDFADNRPYSRTKRYQVTVIDRNPDSE